ncbi:diaminopimelate decarboxylase [Acrocarpospora catenulata]|uniref:diaminopimelate decarboxylase n=1 Tax=Acrocarpospora catenulata TaxID=2836182 RepID=UPI001BDABDBD|nr:diaminopimelate decarboxylase [Acrocarpospora catenulata]
MCVLLQDLTRQPTAASPDPWPTTTLFAEGQATCGGVPLHEIAERFGTPAYVVDEADIRLRCRDYRTALPDATIAYAAKAFLCRGMADWIRREGLALDVCSAGELAIARSTGFPTERMIFHGNAKTPAELREAIGVGRIVIDNLAEIHRLAALVPPGRRQRVLIRVIPDIEAGGHPKIRTGAEGQKFGLSIADGEADAAVDRVLGQPELELVGLHCHLGSQIASAEPYRRAARIMVEQLARIRDRHGVVLPELDLGGGQAIAYLEGEHGLDLREYAATVPTEISRACREYGLPIPHLIVEPGRSISGPSGVTLYRVIAIKSGPGGVFVAVDGGMSDNPRPGLYDARYTVRMIGRRSQSGSRTVTVVGRHCESGDVIARDVALPADLRPGDLLGVAATGAYHHSMASTYNATGRAPVVAVADGQARLLVRREEPDDLLRRDVGL